ncbi:MAG: tetratricopeptide repeat protein [Treponema sp.]|jgi:tetratricopeptide (TPR) repeat protein|nr:tetratricopeptide repeat protein [Treponema sp.]
MQPVLKCRNCGTELPSNAKFCLECGTPVGRKKTVATGKNGTAKLAEGNKKRAVKWDKAISVFTKELDIEKDAEIFWKRGEDYKEKGDISKAYADFIGAGKIDPLYWVRLDLNYTNQEEYQQVINACTEQINAIPDCGNAYSARAGVYKDNGDYQNALADYSKAIEIDPSYSKYYSGLS